MIQVLFHFLFYLLQYYRDILENERYQKWFFVHWNSKNDSDKEYKKKVDKHTLFFYIKLYTKQANNNKKRKQIIIHMLCTFQYLHLNEIIIKLFVHPYDSICSKKRKKNRNIFVVMFVLYCRHQINVIFFIV